MNVFSKLAQARVSLQETNIKKSGKNKHLGFSYSELKDFLPSINVINKNLGLLSVVTFGNNQATISIIDTESEEPKSVSFTSDMAEATLQGKPAPIQELGSQHTYMRRYMYMLAYEIAEGDSVDADLGRTLSKEELEIIAKAEKEIKEAAEKPLKDARLSFRNYLTSIGKDPVAFEEHYKVKIDECSIKYLTDAQEFVQNSIDNKKES
ncbi:ERF family protein [bacterium]|nr:ERF family protein [bacterium]